MKFAVPCNEADIIIVVVSCLSELFHVSVLLLSVNQHIEWLTIICFSQCEELKYSESDSMAYECLWHLQLWTMYCESLAALSFTDTDSYVNAHQTVMDFWGRVTPGILQLLSHSKVVRWHGIFGSLICYYTEISLQCTSLECGFNYNMDDFLDTEFLLIDHRRSYMPV